MYPVHCVTHVSGPDLVRMAGATGLEPATSCVTGRRSNQLNYAPACESADFFLFSRAPSRSLPYHLAVP